MKDLPGTGPNICQSKFIGMNLVKDEYLVGGIFMRKFYTVFDRDNDRVGIALAKASPKVKALAEVSSESGSSWTEMEEPTKSTYIDEE